MKFMEMDYYLVGNRIRWHIGNRIFSLSSIGIPILLAFWH